MKQERLAKTMIEKYNWFTKLWLHRAGDFWRYPRMNTESYQVIIKIINFFYRRYSLHELPSKTFFQTGFLFIKSMYNNNNNNNKYEEIRTGKVYTLSNTVKKHKEITTGKIYARINTGKQYQEVATRKAYTQIKTGKEYMEVTTEKPYTRIKTLKKYKKISIGKKYTRTNAGKVPT